MNKIIFSLLGILLITACSDDNESTSATNNEVTSCNYSFKCENEPNIYVENEKIYTSNDSIFFTNILIEMASIDNWNLNDFINRLSESYWKSFTLNDTLLTETQISNFQHHSIFKLTESDQKFFSSISSLEKIQAFVEKTYNACKEDIKCVTMNQDALNYEYDNEPEDSQIYSSASGWDIAPEPQPSKQTEENNSINSNSNRLGKPETTNGFNPISRDIENLEKLSKLNFEGESTCKLVDTNCKKDRYVTD